MNFPRNADGAGLGDCFEPGRDVNAVTIKVAALDHDVTQIDADAQNDGSVQGQSGVCCSHVPLQLDSALYCLNCACELDEHTVARDLEDTAAMTGHRRLQNVLTPQLESGQGPGLILPHQPTV